MNRIIETVNQTPTSLKAALDVGFVGLAWGSFFTEVMPLIATGLSVIWFSLQIYAWVVNKRWKKK